MKALFSKVLEPVFYDIDGKKSGGYVTQDDAVQGSICALLGIDRDDLIAFYAQVQQYDLLNVLHDQMMKLGYQPAAVESYTLNEPVVEEAGPVEEPVRDVRYELMDLCGAKFSNLLGELDGTWSAANSIRERILVDYAYNSYDEDGVDKLGRVLKYIRTRTLELQEAAVSTVVDPLFGKPYPQVSIRHFVDVLNQHGGDYSTRNVFDYLTEWNRNECRLDALGRVYHELNILDKQEFYHLLERHQLTYDQVVNA